MTEIPSGWNEHSLSEIADVVGGGTPDRSKKEYWNGNIYWVSPTEITCLKNKYITKTRETITDLGLNKSSAKLHPPGTVLMTSRASIGFAAINTVPMATNQGFQSLRCKEKIYNEFLYQLIITKKNELERLSGGSTFLEISSSSLKDFSILVPPLKEQKKIATILTSVDTVIEKTEAEIEKLQLLKKGIMQELLTKGIGHTEFKDSPLGKIPKSWVITTIGKLSQVKRGASPRPIQDPKWWGGKVGWVRISDVTASRKYLYKTSDYLSEAGVEKSVRIKPGEVILSICATIGKPIIINVDVCIHDGFVWFDNLSKLVDKEYLYYYFVSKESELSAKRQSGTQGNLNTNIVSEQSICLPPLKEQKKIAAILAFVDSAIEKTEAKDEKWQKLKKGLTQDLLTGKVRVNID